MIRFQTNIRTITRFQERGLIETVKSEEIKKYSTAEILEILPSMITDFNDYLNGQLNLKPETFTALNAAIKQACERLITLIS